jgi:DNA invertase Pin-like site-specific DNA recombinase
MTIKNQVPEVLSMPRRAYSYKRVSDPKQVSGDGLNRQEDFAVRLCERHGWCLDDSLKFKDRGRSAFHGRHRSGNGQLLQFLEAVKRQRIAPGSVLIIENLDRLSREEMDEAQDLFKGILRAGVWIATEMPERVYKPECLKSLLGTIEPLLYMHAAHEYSKKLSVRIKDKWERRRERARGGQRPVSPKAKRPGWIDWTPRGWALNPGRAATVRMIFRLAAREGMGAGRIAAWLNAHAEAHPPWGTGRRVKRPGEDAGRVVWLRETVRKVLKGREALGEWQPRLGSSGYGMVPDGKPIKSYWPAVLEGPEGEDEWQLAQAAIDARRQEEGQPGRAGRPGACETNLFTGLTREAVSGERMHVRPIRGGPPKARRTYRYLVAARLGEAAGTGRGMAYQPFEDAVLDTIRQLQPRDVLEPDAAVDEREARIAELTKLLPVLENRLDRTGRELDGEDDDEVRKGIKDSLRRLGEERTKAARELETLKLESLTGRGEALAEAQTLVDLLDEVRGTDREPEIRRRLKAAIGWLFDEIWVVVQRFNQMRMVVHAQIYLRSGARRYVRYGPAPRPQEVVWFLRDFDFRGGALPAYVVEPAAGARGA